MSYNRNNRSRNENRTMYDTICSDCEKETQVPFKPDGERPVYCKDCLPKHRTPRNNRY